MNTFIGVGSRAIFHEPFPHATKAGAGPHIDRHTALQQNPPIHTTSVLTARKKPLSSTPPHNKDTKTRGTDDKNAKAL